MHVNAHTCVHAHACQAADTKSDCMRAGVPAKKFRALHLGLAAAVGAPFALRKIRCFDVEMCCCAASVTTH